jgi:hypothetical protein
MNSDVRFKIFFEHQYLIDMIIQNYILIKYDNEDLSDASICSLFKVIGDYDINILHSGYNDFKVYAIFYIKAE